MLSLDSSIGKKRHALTKAWARDNNIKYYNVVIYTEK